MVDKSRTIRIDFRGVDPEIRSRSGRAARVPEGDYLLKILHGDKRQNKNGDGSHISWSFSVISPKEYSGKTLYMVTSLKPDALWNLRNLIHAAIGKNVAGSIANFNPGTIEGKTIAATTEDNEYTNPETGRTRISSQVLDVRPKSQLKTDDEDEDEEDYEDDDEDEVEEEDEDEEDEDEEPPPRARSKAKTKTKSKRRVVEEDDDEDEDLEDVEIEDI